MSRELITLDQAVESHAWGDNEEIREAGRRLQMLLPGGEKLTNNQAIAHAQYAMMLDADPFGGDVYAWNDNGKLVQCRGYLLLVRWAKAEMPYTEEYEIETEPNGDATATIYVLRQDNQEFFRDVLKACLADGMRYNEAKAEARNLCTTSASATATSAEFSGKKKPPNTWNLADVAKKRALKKALRQSHGSPSPAEVRQLRLAAQAPQLSPAGRVTILRGEDEEGID